MVLKWGICCVGLISQDFVSAFLEFKDSSNEITAVAARSEDKAKEFADRFKIPTYFGGYEKLAQFADVDIVYVSAINTEHCRLTKLFLNHGKHVLVEKPMAMNAAEAKEMINLAREKKLFLMEGLWSTCFPIYKRIQNSILDGTIGILRHANINFQVNIGRKDRVVKKELGGGGLLDIGVYALTLALWVFHGKKLVKATSDVKWENDVDTCGTVTLKFENDATVFITYHTLVAGDTSATIYGDAGKIVIPAFMWSPEAVIINEVLDESFKVERKDETFTYNFGRSWYFHHEIGHVAQRIENGCLESDLHPLDQSLKLAELMENLLKH